MVGFQLCYDKLKNERSLTWKKNEGYSHNRIDDGEGRPGKVKSTPILVTDGIFDYKKIGKSFRAESENIEGNISEFIHQKILEYQ